MRNSIVPRNGTLVRRTSLAAGAVAALAVLLSGCGNDDPSMAQDPAAEPSSSAPESTAPPTPSETPTPTPSETPSATPVPKDTLITLDTPEDGATVSGSFQAKGTANSPEANVPWRILDAGGTKVLDGYFTAEGWMDKLYPWTTTVDVSELEPGTYLFIARTDDTSEGEGKPPEEVGARITVE